MTLRFGLTLGHLRKLDRHNSNSSSMTVSSDSDREMDTEEKAIKRIKVLLCSASFLPLSFITFLCSFISVQVFELSRLWELPVEDNISSNRMLTLIN